MNFQRCLLSAYSLMLYLYPAAFRTHFAAEMLELAAAAEPGEWPLIFGDTGVGIVRCWIEGTHSTAAITEPGAYMPIGRSRVSVAGLIPGLVLSILVIAGVSYVSYRWPPPCPNTTHLLTHIVAPPQSKGN